MCYILYRLEINWKYLYTGNILMLTYTQYVQRFKQTKFKDNQTLFYVSKFKFLYTFITPCKIMILYIVEGDSKKFS